MGLKVDVELSEIGTIRKRESDLLGGGKAQHVTRSLGLRAMISAWS